MKVGCVWDHLRDGYLPWGCFVSGWVLGIQKQDEISILGYETDIMSKPIQGFNSIQRQSEVIHKNVFGNMESGRWTG